MCAAYRGRLKQFQYVGGTLGCLEELFFMSRGQGRVERNLLYAYAYISYIYTYTYSYTRMYVYAYVYIRIRIYIHLSYASYIYTVYIHIYMSDHDVFWDIYILSVELGPCIHLCIVFRPPVRTVQQLLLQACVCARRLCKVRQCLRRPTRTHAYARITFIMNDKK